MKRRFPISPEKQAQARARRVELVARSVPIQLARKMGREPFASLPTVNACLEMIYAAETGETEWHTFSGWKENGFSVNKGEKGFAIWGRPLAVAVADAAGDAVGLDLAAAEAAHGLRFFPLSYLFHAGQVSPVAEVATLAHA